MTEIGASLKSWLLHGTDVKLGEMQGTANVGISITESRWGSTGHFVMCYKGVIVYWVHFCCADIVCFQNTTLLLSGNIWLIAVDGVCESYFKGPADTTYPLQMFSVKLVGSSPGQMKHTKCPDIFICCSLRFEFLFLGIGFQSLLWTVLQN